MSASLILSQFAALVARAESMEKKLSPRKIRPTRDQLNQLREHRDKLRTTLSKLDAEVTSLIQPDEEIVKLLDRIRSGKNSLASISTALSRNLILIFTGPKDSSLDSVQVTASKKHTRKRCLKLRSQHPHVTLKWAQALPPSTWKSRGMTDGAFDYLLEALEAERLDSVLPMVHNILQSLEKEEPLNSCDAFKSFVSEILNTTTADESRNTSNISQQKKRSIATDTTHGAPPRKILCTEARFQEIDYKGSSMPTSKLPLLIDRLSTAIKSSEQWKWERRIFLENSGMLEANMVDRTDCLNFFVPKDRNHDISITLTVGHEVGLEVIGEVEAIDL
ncbi:uncharacterized protein BO97DRAFT_472471 [Aspergillus homomorphus CBS 101889]|uniref:Uncharacterized protein n=1 Tax=Aspergillus homomorphus (strain CBS 101889) TaxID=1450537 RepID=A0A395HRG6_ASPHC|nr:hypothetical protein BO97DRAFT_472471 [Aspergillus homomorphus CBS 101889]RAL09438.1 hypothetical protein BO97DRAFT_472471 [Aspergillus homomorphus CBS 101889]